MGESHEGSLWSSTGRNRRTLRESSAIHDSRIHDLLACLVQFPSVSRREAAFKKVARGETSGYSASKDGRAGAKISLRVSNALLTPLTIQMFHIWLSSSIAPQRGPPPTYCLLLFASRYRVGRCY